MFKKIIRQSSLVLLFIKVTVRFSFLSNDLILLLKWRSKKSNKV